MRGGTWKMGEYGERKPGARRGVRGAERKSGEEGSKRSGNLEDGESKGYGNRGKKVRFARWRKAGELSCTYFVKPSILILIQLLEGFFGGLKVCVSCVYCLNYKKK